MAAPPLILGLKMRAENLPRDYRPRDGNQVCGPDRTERGALRDGRLATPRGRRPRPPGRGGGAAAVEG